MSSTCLIGLTLTVFVASADASDYVPLTRPLVGPEFQADLARTISTTWQETGLRDIVRQIASDRRVAIVLDRRIDPTEERSIRIPRHRLDEALGLIAETAGAQMRVVGSTVYIGPPQACGKLRTLVALRTAELLAFERTAGRRSSTQRRILRLEERRNHHWRDLERPADILRRIAADYGLEVEGAEQIPHDLWAGATLAGVSAAEALSLVLIQFDLTFEWTRQAEGIRLRPIPDAVTVTRSYRPKRGTLEETVRLWKSRWPDLRIRLQDGRIVVSGTVEQHEAIAALERPTGTLSDSSKTHPDAPPPLERRRFTLQIRRIPAKVLLDELQKNYDMRFRYDARELARAGIDLDKRISMDVKQATAEEFFRAICDPLGLAFEIDGITVTLKPK